MRLVSSGVSGIAAPGCWSVLSTDSSNKSLNVLLVKPPIFSEMKCFTVLQTAKQLIINSEAGRY